MRDLGDAAWLQIFDACVRTHGYTRNENSQWRAALAGTCKRFERLLKERVPLPLNYAISGTGDACNLVVQVLTLLDETTRVVVYDNPLKKRDRESFRRARRLYGSDRMIGGTLALYEGRPDDRS